MRSSPRRLQSLHTRAGLIALVVCVWCAAVAPAEADWAFGGYLGIAHTLSNAPTLVQPSANTDLTFTSIDYFGESFTSPPYYGIRITYYLPHVTWLGLSQSSLT